MTNGERYNLSAAVFTALTDVECEIDGLLSYDRSVIKMPAQALHQIHSELIQSSVNLNHNPSGCSISLLTRSTTVQFTPTTWHSLHTQDELVRHHDIMLH